MPETLYDRDSIIKNAERITNFCTEKLSKGEDFASNVKCFWASDFADTKNFKVKESNLPKNGVYIIVDKTEKAFGKEGTEPSENWAGKELAKKFPCNSTYQQISEFGLWLSDGLLKPPVQEDKDCEKSFDIYDYLK